jgi:hypothetical protein
MIDVCTACHENNFVQGFFIQYEGLLDLYDQKYAQPGLELYELATDVLKTEATYAKFSHPVDWTWFEIWHHEGRRARHGAAMMAPDYTHWHGTYDLAKHWMTKYIPELREIVHDYKDKQPEKTAALEKKIDEVMNSDNWKWSLNKEDPEVKKARDQRQQEFTDRYK